MQREERVLESEEKREKSERARASPSLLVLAVAPAAARLLCLDVVAQAAALLVQRRARLARHLVRVGHHEEVLAALLLGVGRRVRLRVELLVAVRAELVAVGAALLDL